MTSQKVLKGLAHNIAHHASSGLSCISPHMGRAMRMFGIETTWVELLEESPYPAGLPDEVPLRLGLAALHGFCVSLLTKMGFEIGEVKSVRLHATPAPWDPSGYLLHTRVVITGANDRVYDSGWVA